MEMSGPLVIFSRDLAIYSYALVFMALLENKCDKVGNEPNKVQFFFIAEKLKLSLIYVNCFTNNNYASIQESSDTFRCSVSCIVLRGHQCHNIVLNELARDTIER
jgi:hypothetical protein